MDIIVQIYEELVKHDYPKEKAQELRDAIFDI